MQLRVNIGGRDEGGGAVIAPGLVLTARHVVIKGHPTDIVVAGAGGQPRSFVSGIRTVERNDLAALDIDPRLPAFKYATAIGGEAWEVTCPPSISEAHLTGRVTAERRPWRNSDGHAVEAVQLLVDQEVGDYAGYSGSPVTVNRGPESAVCALLVEQQPERQRLATEQVRRNANVLYAIPVIDALGSLGITNAVEAPFAAGGSNDRLRESRHQARQSQETASTTSTSMGARTYGMDALRSMRSMLASGALSSEEFANMKSRKLVELGLTEAQPTLDIMRGPLGQQYTLRVLESWRDLVAEGVLTNDEFETCRKVLLQEAGLL